MEKITQTRQHFSIKTIYVVIIITIDSCSGYSSSTAHVRYFDTFGTFEIKERAKRIGRNPKTGAAITIAAAKIPSFKAGKNLKVAVNA